MSNLDLAKWTEFWLDRANERAYQSAFVSALFFHGYTVLHNTSHNPMEQGKDVIALSPVGELVAFQLKGNPGSRLTPSQWFELVPQINQLAFSRVGRSLNPHNLNHKPVLVTNGEIEESVRAFVDSFNSQSIPTAPGAQPIELWSRGNLVKFFLEAFVVAWPADISAQIIALKAATYSGTEIIEHSDLQALFLQTLKWEADDDQRKLSVPATLEKLSGLMTLINVMIAQHQKEGNLFETIKVKTIFAVLVTGYLEEFDLKTRKHIEFLDLIISDLREEILYFSSGIAKNYKDQPMIDSFVADEFAFANERKVMVLSLLAACFLAFDGKDINEDIVSMLRRDTRYPFVSWEGIIPAYLLIFWAQEHIRGDRDPDRILYAVTRALIQKSHQGKLSASYYSLEEVVRWQYRHYLHLSSPIEHDERESMAQFPYVMTLLLTKRNWKQSVKYIWSEVSKILRMEALLPRASLFGFHRCELSEERTIITPVPQTWTSLLDIVEKAPEPLIPSALIQRPWLAALYLVFAPHRANESIVLWLDDVYGKCWYGPRRRRLK